MPSDDFFLSRLRLFLLNTIASRGLDVQKGKKNPMSNFHLPFKSNCPSDTREPFKNQKKDFSGIFLEGLPEIKDVVDW